MGGGPTSPFDLRALLTPEFLASLVRARLPYDPRAPIDFSEFGLSIFLTDPISPSVKTTIWRVLKKLSTIGLEHMPDLTLYLPAPTDPAYPEQTLGLLLLLDHFPRLMFRGVDQRWTYGYFSHLSRRVARAWHALPPAQRPDSWARWQQMGAGLDYWIAVRFWMGTPFVHSERAEDQEVALLFTEETRAAVEMVSGMTDPYRAERGQILADLYGFPRVYKAGPPQGDGVTREGWTFWMGMLMDVHKPIIDRFGRYPYLNSMLAREGTPEEEVWVAKTEHFGEADEETKRRIQEDVKHGRWTPLGEGSHGQRIHVLR